MSGIEAHVVHEQDCEVEQWPHLVSWRTLISADRTPTQAITMGTAEIPCGASVEGARHRHGAPEAYYVISGHGTVNLDGEERPVSAGSAVFVPGGTWHFVRNTGSTTLRVLYVLAVDDFTEVEYERA